MKTKRKQKRYKSTTEIEAEIDNLHDCRRLAENRAPIVDERIAELHKIIYDFNQKHPNPTKTEQQQIGAAYEQRKEYQREATDLKKGCKRITRKLMALKEKWAASKTETMPFLPDASVI